MRSESASTPTCSHPRGRGSWELLYCCSLTHYSPGFVMNSAGGMPTSTLPLGGGGGGAGTANNAEALVQRVLKQRKVKEKASARELPATAARKQIELLGKYLRLLRRSADQQSFMPLVDRVGQIRQLVITEGLPEEGLERRLTSKRRWSHQCSLRGLVWKVLLGTYHVDAPFYIRLVEAGASSRDAKIRDDTFRTFRTDELFHLRVHEDMMTRVLNAFVRLNFADEGSAPPSSCQPPPPPGNDSKDTPAVGGVGGNNNALTTGVSRAVSGGQGGVGGRYVQGMNVLCGLFLFVMPEMDAFFSFNTLLTRHCPGYITANLDGVHVGCDLVDRCLALLDPVLHGYLKKKGVHAQLFAFPLLLSLYACVPPLSQVLLVWDVLFAFGVHLDVLMCVAQVLLLRESLLLDPSPMMSLRPEKLPPLDAPTLLALAFELIPLLPADLYKEIVVHPFVISRERKPPSQAPGSSLCSSTSGTSTSAGSNSTSSNGHSPPPLQANPIPTASNNGTSGGRPSLSPRRVPIAATSTGPK